MKFTTIFLLSIFSFLNGNAQKAIDGLFQDWTDEDTKVLDDDAVADVDILSVSISHDSLRLFILLELDREVDIQDGEDFSIFIDADNDASTGFQRAGIGAELTYYFERKQGFINAANGSSISVNHAPLDVMSAPTVTSHRFEIAISRSVEDSGISATMQNEISIYIQNGLGDEVPNIDGGIKYTFLPKETFTTPIELEKRKGDFRFMTYNVENDGIMSTDRQAAYERIFSNIKPDILALQEVRESSTAEIVTLLNQWSPCENGANWQAAKTFSDVMLCTCYQIEAFDPIDGNAVFLVFDDQGRGMVIYNLHLPCCDRDAERQEEIDHILSVLRDREAASEIGFVYTDDLPVIITGDLNLVGAAQNYASLVNGDIVDNATYGPDFGPDLDGTTLEDAAPYVGNYPGNYTWTNPFSIYHAGRLDFIFYTGSALTDEYSLTLDTKRYTPAMLDRYGLEAADTGIASDHLPLFSDFGFASTVDADGDGVTEDEDCDDNNADVFPNAPELCDGLDNNCDGNIDEGIAVVSFYIDADGDGYGDPATVVMACTQPTGMIAQGGDCDDTNPQIFPTSTELCDGLDNNCDGNIDESIAVVSFYMDADGDGYGDPMTVVMACAQPTGMIAQGGDCDDTNADVFPGNTELPYNNQDDDCDPTSPDNDLDGDGFLLVDDCDDTDADINPAAQEVPYNGTDEDCNPQTLDDDLDQDGFLMAEDCDDTNKEIYPGAPEILDNDVDEDCDGLDLSGTYDLSGIALNVYPNPVYDSKVIIRVEVNLDFTAILFDINGRRLGTYNNPQVIDLSAYRNAILLLQLMDNTNGNSIVEKLIVE